MRSLAIAALSLLAACSAETGFQNADPDDVAQDGNATAEITPSVVEFADLEVAITRSEILKVSSVGENNLLIYEIRIKDSAEGVFYCEEEEDVTLAPGTSREFAMTATLLEEGYVEGSVRVKTNDPDFISVEVPLRAWTAGHEPEDPGDDTGA